jgi:histidyl-tRNA synthetase
LVIKIFFLKIFTNFFFFFFKGLIYEAVLTSGNTTLGSIAGGGRYDGLIGMFSGK